MILFCFLCTQRVFQNVCQGQLRTSLPHIQISPCSVPLGAAAYNGHISTIEKLLEGGANIHKEDKVKSACYACCKFTSYITLLHVLSC